MVPQVQSVMNILRKTGSVTIYGASVQVEFAASEDICEI